MGGSSNSIVANFSGETARGTTPGIGATEEVVALHEITAVVIGLAAGEED